jgi:hypothetical protein
MLSKCAPVQIADRWQCNVCATPNRVRQSMEERRYRGLVREFVPRPWLSNRSRFFGVFKNLTTEGLIR